MAADSMASARRTPLITAVPKMLFPFLVILPGLLALALTYPQNHGPDAQTTSSSPASVTTANPASLIPPETNPATGQIIKDQNGEAVLNYNMVIPNMLLHYFPSGMLRIGLTALLASFMSGMAGNVTAFNTVWTYDIYQSYIRRQASDEHYLRMAQFATIFGVLLSVAVAYFVAAFNG
jgi:solute:Na+ symporter, SSS family